MHTITAHEYASQYEKPFRQFDAFNCNYVISLLADMHASVPGVREFIFHGHELRQPALLQQLTTLNNITPVRNLKSLSDRSQPNKWMWLDAFTCSADQLTEIIQPYETGMIYVPAKGTSAKALGDLIIQQTCGLGSLFQPKTYRNFLGLDVFLAVKEGYYSVKIQ